MDRCDRCGAVIDDQGYWLHAGRKSYRFCSVGCMNLYEPTDDWGVVL